GRDMSLDTVSNSSEHLTSYGVAGATPSSLPAGRHSAAATPSAAEQVSAEPPLGQDELETWSDDELEEDGGWFSDESTAFIGSLLVHLAVLLVLGVTPLLQRHDTEAIVMVASRPDAQVEELRIIEEVSYSELPQDQVGANSTTDTAMAEASAEMF